jgi:DNA polymerase
VSFRMPQIVRAGWLLDQQINERGIFIDRMLLDSAISLAACAKQELHDEIRKLTRIDNTASNPQMMAWLRMHGYPFQSLEKSWVARAIKEGVPEDVRRVLALRGEAARTSDSKLTAIRNTVSADGRLRYLFNYLGASRAGRWTSHTVQFQNLPKPLFEDRDGSRIKLARELVRSGDYEAVRKEFGSVMDAVVSVIRTVFCAPEGSRLVIVDLNAIEARMIGWLAGCETMLEAFRAGRDIYVEFAAEVLGVPADQLPREYRNKFGKPGILGSGYGQGPGAEVVDAKSGELIKTGMWGFAQRQGISLTLEEAQRIVSTYRQKYAEVPQLWRDYEEGMRWCMGTGATVPMHKVTFRRFGTAKPTIQVQLPSTRCLHYVNCRVGTKARDDGQGNVWQSPTILYDGVHQKTRTWGAIDTWGGKLTENFDQAISRDVLVEGMFRAERAGFSIVAHCHDELICEVPDDSHLGKDELVQCMVTPPEWAPDLPLAAEAESSRFYKK